MKKSVALLSWRWLLWIGWAVIAVYLALLVYYSATGAFDVVDGGIALASGVGYLVVGLLVMGVLHLLAKFMPNLPRVNRVVLIGVWVVLLLSIVAISLNLIQSAQEDRRQASIEAALQTCTIRSVAWTFQPQQTVIEYSDRAQYRMDGYVQPTQVEAMVRDHESRCGHDISATFNGTPMRRFY